MLVLLLAVVVWWWWYGGGGMVVVVWWWWYGGGGMVVVVWWWRYGGGGGMVRLGMKNTNQLTGLQHNKLDQKLVECYSKFFSEKEKKMYRRNETDGSDDSEWVRTFGFYPTNFF